jgi:2-(1,2-epoxy-1,2-dihydrophenyl)acetyl-CoA isomerase
VGLARARNFLFTNDSWDAATAAGLGVVTKVVADADIDAEGLALAHHLANGPADVIGLAKQLLLKSFESSVTEMMEYEGFGQVLAMSSVEFREGLAAAVDKRKPDFAGASAKDPKSDGMPSSVPGPAKV